MGDSQKIDCLLLDLAQKVANGTEYTKLALALEIPATQAAATKYNNRNDGMALWLKFLF